MFDEGLCQYHHSALAALRRSYDKWARGFGELSWNAYLQRIIKLPNTGVLVKEVAVLGLREDLGRDGQDGD